jgi:predicted ATPase
VALAFEDLQWADPTSLDLMRALAERGAQTPLFIVAAARPEFRPPWGMRPHHSVIALAPLGRAEVARMVGEIASHYALSREVIEDVSERTGGVPLFVEEVTRLLLERGEQGGAQAIPPTLQQSLAARLDRLGPAREIAQIGAALGCDFSYALLANVAAVTPVAALDGRGSPAQARLSEAGYKAAVDDRGLQLALDRLIEADILIVEGVGHEATYRFKHALIRDAAYEGLLKSRRQALHRRAAEALREAEAEPEEIAHHYTEARLDDLAIEWWGKAGDQALRRSAFQEAIAHLGKAIAMADRAWGAVATKETSDSAVSTRRLKLQADYGRAVMSSKGLAADETKAALDRVREIAAAAQDPAERVAGYYGRWAWSLVRVADLRSAREIAETFLSEAEAEGRTTEAGVARRVLGLTCVMQGELVLARDHLERAVRDYVADRDRESRFRFGWDTGILAAMLLAWPVWFQGEVERARQLSEQAIRDAIDSGHPATLVHARWMELVLEGFRHNPAATLRSGETLVQLGREHRMDLHAVVGEVFACWARGRLDDPETGAQSMREALKTYSAQGRIHFPYFHGLRSELEAVAQGADVALRSIDDGLAIAEETGDHISDSFLHRLRGEMLLKRDPANPVPAQEAFQTAIAIAKGQGARSYVLLASLSLAKLYQATGRRAKAHAVLAPALEGFSPTPELPEIAEAQALLGELA